MRLPLNHFDVTQEPPAHSTLKTDVHHSAQCVTMRYLHIDEVASLGREGESIYTSNGQNKFLDFSLLLALFPVENCEAFRKYKEYKPSICLR